MRTLLSLTALLAVASGCGTDEAPPPVVVDAPAVEAFAPDTLSTAVDEVVEDAGPVEVSPPAAPPAPPPPAVAAAPPHDDPEMGGDHEMEDGHTMDDGSHMDGESHDGHDGGH